MGNGPQGRRRRITAKKKQYKKASRTRVRAKDVDQIQDEIKKMEESDVVAPLPIDDDLPGRGQFYCISCARHFINDDVLAYHYRTKQHKRRLKAVMADPYSQAEAEAGAGMGATAK
uniref:C2H2-type domain-containing protein n=1 Tax=Bicosoecida sp. CB-2014 TaxID=1486930 RepID=A0A7S1GEP6_9STRA|mmetsp:Transcript_7525/g.26866  ORF Transcript_7525/g.26866 Transcript_7525/m.26866 type:complete len:116 (+) Transcript_7525:188-535(+)